MTEHTKAQLGKQYAELFHDMYENLAPAYGYETRPDTKQFDPESKNGRLMIAVIGYVLGELLASKKAAIEGREYVVDPNNLYEVGFNAGIFAAVEVLKENSHTCPFNNSENHKRHCVLPEKE